MDVLKRPLATVGGLIVAPDGEILLVRSKKWSDLYSLPGGKIEWGETREEALRREVWEETGLKIVNVQFALVQDCIFSPEFYQKRHFVMHDYLAELEAHYSKNDVKLNREAYEYRWVSPNKALKLSLHQECRFLIDWYVAKLKKRAKKDEGIIGIHQLQLNCIVGIYPEERKKEQPLWIDLKIKHHLAKGAATGHIADTVDYGFLKRLCLDLATQNQYQLLETFAFDILDHCINHLPISWAWVRVRKPEAIADAAYAFVELERYKEEE